MKISLSVLPDAGFRPDVSNACAARIRRQVREVVSGEQIEPFHAHEHAEGELCPNGLQRSPLIHLLRSGEPAGLLQFRCVGDDKVTCVVEAPRG
ncbi:MAG: hypothetical protein ABI379_12820 [Rhodanobacter sp.]